MKVVHRVFRSLIIVIALLGIWYAADLLFIMGLGLFSEKTAAWDWSLGRVVTVTIFGWGCAYIGICENET